MKKVYLLDDDLLYLKTMGNILEIEGYDVKATSSPARFFSWLSEDIPDLVLVDVVMPEIDGFQVLEKLKKEYPQVIAALVSGEKFDNEMINKATSKGAVAIFPKPVEINEMLKFISEHGKKEILIIDDDPKQLYLLKEILNDKDFTVTLSEEPEEGLKLIENKNWDFIILDIRLPGTNGVDILKKIKNIKPDIPVIMASAYSLDVWMEEEIRKNAVGFLPKPIELSILFNLLNKLCKNKENILTANILIIDDDEFQRQTLKEILFEVGYNIKEAKEASESLEIIKKTQVELALVDYHLGSTNGLVLAQEIKKKSPLTEIILITGHASLDSVIEALRGDVTDYLVKPIDPDKLISTVKKTLEKQLLEQERMSLRKQERKILQELMKINEIQNLFFSKISHEVLAPLTTIKSYTTILRSGETAEEKQKILDIMYKEGERLERLIRDMRDIGRLRTGKLEMKKEKINFINIFNDSIEKLKPAITEKNIKLSLKIREQELFILADPDRIIQIIINLINNSIKFTPGDGEIEIEIFKDNNFLETKIKDNGTGIEPEKLDLVFSPFVQLDSSKKGMGLGLTITREIISAHGGKIKVESEGTGRGTIFSFLLPLVLEK